MRKRAAKLAASAGTAMLAASIVTGCADGQGPGVAARVDDTVISTTQVDEGMALGPFYSQAPNPASIVTNLIHASIVVPVASENGLGVSDEDAATFLDGLEARSIQVDGHYTQPVLDLVKLSLAAEAANASPQGDQVFTEVSDRLSVADVNVNPRYGTWDDDTAQLGPAVEPWLVSGAPENQ